MHELLMPPPYPKQKQDAYIGYKKTLLHGALQFRLPFCVASPWRCTRCAPVTLMRTVNREIILRIELFLHIGIYQDYSALSLVKITEKKRRMEKYKGDPFIGEHSIRLPKNVWSVNWGK